MRKEAVVIPVDQQETQGAIEETMRRFEADARYFEEHADALRARYPEQWVAIWHGEVREIAPTLAALLDAAARADLPIGELIVEYLSPDPFIVL